ncbi:MAG: N-acetylneuraminate lyase [Clostridia bacterium]|nr:N-acetylneuraminate lyase [Clostridia bacterium]
MKKITGVIPAFISPFTENGIDTNAAQAHAKRLVEKGATGLYVGGSTGEMIFMSVSERKTLLEAVVDAVPKDFPIIAHVGAANPADAFDMAKHADKAGAAAISSVAPFYYKYTYAEIKKYYQKLSGSISIPTIVYNVPNLSGAALSGGQLGELMNMENVSGMKFTSSDYYTFERLRSAFPDKALYNGCDEMLCAGLAMGADGGIGTTYNIMIDKFVKIYELFGKGMVKEAFAVQNGVNDVVEQLFKYSLLPAVKYLVKLTGCDCGVCREPFLPLTEDEEKALAASVKGKLSWDI